MSWTQAFRSSSVSQLWWKVIFQSSKTRLWNKNFIPRLILAKQSFYDWTKIHLMAIMSFTLQTLTDISKKHSFLCPLQLSNCRIFQLASPCKILYIHMDVHALQNQVNWPISSAYSSARSQTIAEVQCLKFTGSVCICWVFQYLRSFLNSPPVT